MSDLIVNSYPPPISIQENAHISSFSAYKSGYEQSINDPVKFWKNVACQFHWKQFPSDEKFLDYNFSPSSKIYIRWMQDGITNICYNCLDLNVDNGKADKVAFHWEGNDPKDFNSITYGELLMKTCVFANLLKSKGIQKGDRVAIYMPMVEEIIIAMLACARIGAVHSIVFGGFSAASLSDRILDSKCRILITADAHWRGTKLVNLKDIADEAMSIVVKKGHAIEACIVLKHVSVSDELHQSQSDQPGSRPIYSLKVNMQEHRDIWWHDSVKGLSDVCEPEWLSAEDPLFMLYTSGSTGTPKGVLHTCGGYMVYTATTTKYVFDIQPADIYWCSADVGWITGHSYVCYGPLLNGTTSIIFEGTPFYPDCGRVWEIIEKYKVTKFYTAPTAIRSLMKFGDDFVKKYNRDSLKILGTVGEPINPEAWLWYHKVVGNSTCAIVDTFWQTETGGHVITPLPGAISTKPGSATFPFFGVVPELLSESGEVIEGVGDGYLVFKKPWPGMMRTVYGNHERFERTYFNKFPGYYCTGDGAHRDSDGYFWITGRIDDMLNVSGHLLSTAQVESAIIEHPAVAENAAVSHPHTLKGECLYCFVTLKDGYEYTPKLVKELKDQVRSRIGPFAQPDYMQEAPALPKTRSGKIMRRILRKIAVNDKNLGDVSTMADESVVDTLFNLRCKTSSD